MKSGFFPPKSGIDNSLMSFIFFFSFASQIAEDLRPNPVAISVLTKLSYIIPTWKIIPTKDIIDTAFKVPEVRQEVQFISNIPDHNSMFPVTYEYLRQYIQAN